MTKNLPDNAEDSIETKPNRLGGNPQNPDDPRSGASGENVRQHPTQRQQNAELAGSLPPGSIASAFPSEAVVQLREHQRQLDGFGVEVGVSRQAVDEVLAWVDQFVPRSLPNCELSLGQNVGELVIEEPDLVVDLIRCNGRTFVPETPTIELEAEPALPPEIAGSQTVIEAVAQRYAALRGLVWSDLLQSDRNQCRADAKDILGVPPCFEPVA